MPYPQNLETALEVEAIVRARGCVPATVAVMDGRLRVGTRPRPCALAPPHESASSCCCCCCCYSGLAPTQLEALAKAGPQAVKTSRRDMAAVLARRAVGATTVAGTMVAAHLAGIRVFVTGGLGACAPFSRCRARPWVAEARDDAPRWSNQRGLSMSA
jgi:pseudouridine-5'-phosphate glycosidase